MRLGPARPRNALAAAEVEAGLRAVAERIGAGQGQAQGQQGPTLVVLPSCGCEADSGAVTRVLRETNVLQVRAHRLRALYWACGWPA